METKLLGRWGEEQAAAYLKEKHYMIVGMNYSSRFGEIDLIAEDRRFIVFVEVKLRKSDRFATAGSYVTAAKQQRLIATARMYLASHVSGKQPRFDVIEIYAPSGIGGPKHIHHIENAFEVSEP